MKLIVLLLLLSISSPVLAEDNVKSKVDPRVELFSIIFRLAGNPEYNMKLHELSFLLLRSFIQ